MKVFCVYSLESPHRGDSNEYTRYTIFNVENKITLNSNGLKNEFETAIVNEPSVFEPLKFYCIYSFSPKSSAKAIGFLGVATRTPLQDCFTISLLYDLYQYLSSKFYSVCIQILLCLH